MIYAVKLYVYLILFGNIYIYVKRYAAVIVLSPHYRIIGVMNILCVYPLFTVNKSKYVKFVSFTSDIFYSATYSKRCFCHGDEFYCQQICGHCTKLCITEKQLFIIRKYCKTSGTIILYHVKHILVNHHQPTIVDNIILNLHKNRFQISLVFFNRHDNAEYFL